MADDIFNLAIEFLKLIILEKKYNNRMDFE